MSNSAPPFALFVRGPNAVIFDLSDQLGFEMPMQALAVSVFEDGADMMFVQALFETEAEARACADALDLSGLEYSISQLPDEDWTSKSQAGLPPVEAGRFFIYGSHDGGNIPMHTPYPIRIDAGLAFGTGHHGTTKGCLLAFEALCAPRSKVKKIAHWPKTILDLGCGSGVLAIAAAMSLNRDVVASDIDIDAVDVTRQNARINGVAERVQAEQADGIVGTDKFDLIFANILAGPLMVLAPDITEALAGGGHVILAGLLDAQADKAIACYMACGLHLVRRSSLSGWTILTMALLHKR
ncbi:MAG: 50S ribosomal protein L11 methyltransferase [Robiginitomaculum sp.]|nr:50S ribosomal protein L11 methyltransferase [Robiginitomaculum sp.]